MAENKLTDKHLRGLKPGPSEKALGDGGGLWIRAMPADKGGAINFYYRFQFGGKERRYNCGTYPETSLAMARQRRNEARQMVASGIDPVIKEANDRAVNISSQVLAQLEKTVNDLFDDWKRVYLSAHRKDGGAFVESIYDHDVRPILGQMKAKDVKLPHIVQVIHKLLDRKVRRKANMVLSTLRQMFRHGLARGLVALAALLTSKVYSDRILGHSKIVSVPTNALVLFTGNNIRLKGDLPRRIPKCRIDPAMEAPHERAFPFDPLELATTNRQKIVAAALTLIRAAQNAKQAGQSTGAGRLASFEVWDEFVRQTVCWLADLQTQGQMVIGHDASGLTIPALTDPMEAISAAVADDPVTVQLGRLLTTWVAELGTGLGADVTVQHLAVPPTHSIPPVRNASSGGSSLYDILCEVASPHPVNHSVCTRRLGKYLASAKGRVVGGYSLREGPKRQGSISWWVEQVAANASSAIASAGGPVSVASTAATVSAAPNPPLRLVAAGP